MLVKEIPVCIIGGGPSGVMAASHLAEMGVRSLILEAQHMPRDKVCADIITSKAIREIERAHPGCIAEWADTGRSRAIWSTRVYTQEQYLDIPFRGLDDDPSRPSCYAISRKDMDLDLWNRIRELESVTALDGVRVTGRHFDNNGHTLTTDQGTSYRAEHCILAHGGIKDKEAVAPDSPSRHEAIGIRAYFKGLKNMDGERCHLFLSKEWMPGGLYIAPLPHGVFNVNMVIRKDRIQKGQLNLRSELEKAIREDERLKEIFRDASMISTVRGARLPLATMNRDILLDGALLTGDAAGLIDLISANGIPQAMISGRLSARFIEYKSSGMSLESAARAFAQELKKEIGPDVSLGRTLSFPLGHRWFCSWMLNILDRSAHTFSLRENGLEEVLYSDRPFQELMRQLNPLIAHRKIANRNPIS